VPLFSSSYIMEPGGVQTDIDAIYLRATVFTINPLFN